MCYGKAFLTRKKEQMAERYGHDPAEVGYISEQLNQLSIAAAYHASGFDHPSVPVIIDATKQIHLYSWGLIPA